MRRYLSLGMILFGLTLFIGGCSFGPKMDVYIDGDTNGENIKAIGESPIFYTKPNDEYIEYIYYDRDNSLSKEVNIGYEYIAKEDLLTISDKGDYLLAQKNMGKGIDRLIDLTGLKSYKLTSSGYQMIGENKENILLQRFDENKNQWTIEMFNKSSKALDTSEFYKNINETSSEINRGISLGEKRFLFVFKEGDGTYLAYVNNDNLMYTKISDEIMRDIKILQNGENEVVIYKGYKEEISRGVIDPKIIFIRYEIKDDTLKAQIDKTIDIENKNNRLDGSESMEFIRDKEGYLILFRYQGNGAMKLFKVGNGGELTEVDAVNNFDTKKVISTEDGFYCFDGKDLVLLKT